MSNIAQACIDNLLASLQSIAKLTGKTIQVYTEDELLDKTKQISLPAAGVMYEGMRAIHEQSAQNAVKSTHRLGTSAEAVLSIMIIETSGVTGSSNSTKAISTELLDTIRNKIMGTKSPSGHYWRFVVEAAAEPKKGATFWIQRWATPVLLVPGNKPQDNPG
jgi:imidazoleglycerol phosphate synthase glutamine amidotransferase subunit HisH